MLDELWLLCELSEDVLLEVELLWLETEESDDCELVELELVLLLELLLELLLDDVLLELELL